jgi:hypothetical protein
MATPTLIAADGRSTVNWKKIVPVLIQFDPYVPSNRKGGQRLAKDLQKYERETEQVVISAASQDLWTFGGTRYLLYCRILTGIQVKALT